jgi:predicted signal transduction protein with EAL and GGDEF domain
MNLSGAGISVIFFFRAILQHPSPPRKKNSLKVWNKKLYTYTCISKQLGIKSAVLLEYGQDYKRKFIWFLMHIFFSFFFLT